MLLRDSREETNPDRSVKVSPGTSSGLLASTRAANPSREPDERSALVQKLLISPERNANLPFMADYKKIVGNLTSVNKDQTEVLNSRAASHLLPVPKSRNHRPFQRPSRCSFNRFWSDRLHNVLLHRRRYGMESCFRFRRAFQRVGWPFEGDFRAVPLF